MNNKKLSKMLTIGLAFVLAFSLVAAALPVGEAVAGPPLKWNDTATPSIEPDKVLQPGTDLCDMAVSTDGDTVYVAGMLGPSPYSDYGMASLDGDGDGCGYYLLHDYGNNGYFEVYGGWISVNCDGSVCGYAYGNNDDLADGGFYAEMAIAVYDPTGLPYSGWMEVYGEVDGDMITFCGTATLPEAGWLPCGPIEVGEGDIQVIDGCLHWNNIGEDFEIVTGSYWTPKLWKSSDGGESWIDITAKVQGAKHLPSPYSVFTNVAIAPDDEDFFTVAGYRCTLDPDFPMECPDYCCEMPVMVVASKDGGSNFTYTGDTVDNAYSNARVDYYDDSTLQYVFDMDIGPEVNGVHSIAVAGMNDVGSYGQGCVFRLDAGTWLTASWDDTSDNNGWKDLNGAVTSVMISPNFDMDRAIVTIGNTFVFVDDEQEYFMQSGTWEPGPSTWNTTAGFTPPVNIRDTGNPIEDAYSDRGATGIAMPTDYDGTLPPKAVVLIYVNGYNPTVDAYGGWVFRVDFGDVSPRTNPSNNPPLASIDYYGTVDSGKALVGSLCTKAGCMSSQVWRAADLDICCPKWYPACKPPTGYDTCPVLPETYCGYIDCDWSVEYNEFACIVADCGPGFCWYDEIAVGCELYPWGSDYLCSDRGGFAQVVFTADGEKAYAITQGAESAFSVSLDDGRSWNQTGLIDTMIDCLGDVQVTGDCDKAYLSSTNWEWSGSSCWCIGYPMGPSGFTNFMDWLYGLALQYADGNWEDFLWVISIWDADLADCISMCSEWDEGCINSCFAAWEPSEPVSCDSIWRSEVDDDHATIGAAWQRVFTEQFSDGCCCCPEKIDIGNDIAQLDELECADPGLIRIPIDEIHPSAVYVGDMWEDNLWYSLDQGQCWTKTPAVPLDIYDFAVENESTVYALDVDGFVTKSDAYGRHWTKPVNTKVGSGHTIAVMEEGNVLVGGHNGGKVAHSDDGAGTFSLTPPLPGQTGNDVHVAWAPLCPDTIFAATDSHSSGGGGIFRYVMGDPGWKDLGATPMYTDLGDCDCDASEETTKVDFTGIVLGKSDGTLYASYYSYMGFDTIVPYILSGVARNLDPCETACCDDENWSWLTRGLGCACEGSDCSKICGGFKCQPSALRICGCWTADSDSTLWSIDCGWYDMTEGRAGDLWQYVDCVA
ncbi:WD40/YVTN/BNR-like repeat-containing protein, partial [Chloroflexota bacterium]